MRWLEPVAFGTGRDVSREVVAGVGAALTRAREGGGADVGGCRRGAACPPRWP